MKTKKKTNEFNPYAIDKLSNVKPGVKIGIMKFWLAGAAFFFSFSALSVTVYDDLDRFVFLLLLLGLSTEYISNKVIIWMNNDHQKTLKYLPFNIERRKVWSLLLSFIYSGIVMVMSVYAVILLMKLSIPTIGMLLFGFDYQGVDPFTFGILYYLIDLLWLMLKNKVWKESNLHV